MPHSIQDIREKPNIQVLNEYYRAHMRLMRLMKQSNEIWALPILFLLVICVTVFILTEYSVFNTKFSQQFNWSILGGAAVFQLLNGAQVIQLCVLPAMINAQV